MRPLAAVAPIRYLALLLVKVTLAPAAKAALVKVVSVVKAVRVALAVVLPVLAANLSR